MRLTIYITSFLIIGVLLFYGVMGNLDAAVSYKFEIEDPIVGINLDKLPEPDREIGYAQLEAKKNAIALQEYFYTGLLIFSVVSFILLLIYRRRVLGKSSLKGK